MFATYRRVLSEPGALAFSATGLLARMPMSMMGIGIVLLVAGATGSYTLAGTVSAAYIVSNAVFAIAQGRLLDSFGQSKVLLAAATVFAAGCIALMAAVQLGWPPLAAAVAAAAAGAGFPQIGSSVRARWAHAIDDAGRLSTAYALEGVADETVFIVGPVLVTLLATSVHPLAGLGVAVVVGTAGTLAFISLHATEPPARGRGPERVAVAPMPWLSLAPVIVIMIALGSLFGSAEVTTVAFAEEFGATQWAGPLLALWAFGSLLAGVWYGAVQWRRDPGFRLAVGSVGMMVAMAPLPFIGSLGLMGAVLLVAGFAISPTLISAMSVIQVIVPRGRLTEGMSIAHTGLAAGVGAGAALAGALIDRSGSTGGYLVPVTSGAIAALSGTVILRRLRRAGPQG